MHNDRSALSHRYSQGAEPTPSGVRFRTWAAHREAQLIIYEADGTLLRTLPMTRLDKEYFEVSDPHARPGDLYKYSFGGSSTFPDPASRHQPRGVHGPSMVIANDFNWTDAEWKPPTLSALTIYELHIGAFTAEGTFAAAMEKLDHLRGLGVNSIEIMPVADFPGNRNWGYDGVSAYAPARVYGTPDEFRRFIDAAHANGLAVILDVVYNHFGPDGNYLAAFHPDYFHSTHKTPWGAAFNFELQPVRKFFLENIAYWMDEFHIDGFRLDATHTIADNSDVHVLSAIAATARERGGFVIAEDERNDARLLTDASNGGVGLDGCWADDFHHVVNVMLTGAQDAYFKNYEGSSAELATTLTQGWLYTGQVQKTTSRPRGNDPSSLPVEKLIYCISNHDQVGNRAFGERFAHLISPAEYRAASALLLLGPFTPLLFMGQEWAASTPFQFFTDHTPELGQKITVGRRHEFRDFAAFRDPATRERIPSPQAEQTFLRSKLKWEECTAPNKQGVVSLYRECIRLRKELLRPEIRSRGNWNVSRICGDIVVITYQRKAKGSLLVVANLRAVGITLETLASSTGISSFRTLFRSNAPEFCDAPADNGPLPETFLLESI